MKLFPKSHISSILLLTITLLVTFSCSKKNAPNKSDNSISKGITFLINNQESDGSWSVIKHGGSFQGGDGVIAVTSIALVSLLNYSGHNDTKKVNVAIKKGIAYLWANQQPTGNIGKNNYANGLGFYALSMAITKDKALVNNHHQKLFKNILSKQSTVGAWDYAIANNHRNDLSISAWIALGLSECIKIKEYHLRATKSVNQLLRMLDQDQRGSGDNSIATKGNSAYTYGNKPNLNNGKELRKPGSTIQAVVLRIKSISNPHFSSSNWALKAFNDQSNKPLKKTKINYYRLFFFTSALKQANLNKLKSWKKETYSIIKSSQSIDGSFPLTTINMQFGGKVMSTAIVLLTLNNLK